jgi:hypothetical protein
VKVYVRRGWFFWQAQYADEPVGEIDLPTTFRSRTREGAIEKCQRAFSPAPSRWEEVDLAAASPSPGAKKDEAT